MIIMKKKYFLIHSIITLLVINMLSGLIFKVISASYSEKLNNEVREEVRKDAHLIQETFSEKLYLVDTLSIVLKFMDYKTDAFENWASIIYESESGISSLQLAPDGIVRNIYPLENNSIALGHNLLLDDSRDNGAKESIESRDLIFIGPVKLIQNGNDALITRKPIFKDNGMFWGFTTVIIELDDLGLNDFLHTDKYNYEIIGYDPDSDTPPKIYSNCDLIEGCYVEYPIFMPGATWVLRMSAKRNKYFPLIHLAAHLIATLLGLFYLSLHHKVLKKSTEIYKLNKKLDKLSKFDELTGLLNRRGINIHLKDSSINHNGNFSVALMDLNLFKRINDTYGHAAGDNALIHFTHILLRTLAGFATLGRLGGDEFLCIFTGMLPSESKELIDKFQKKLETSPLIFDDYTIYLSCSVGLAHHIPGEDIDDILARADESMYTEKKASD